MFVWVRIEGTVGIKDTHKHNVLLKLEDLHASSLSKAQM